MRRAVPLACLAVLLLGGALAAYWHWSSRLLATQIAAWTEQQRAAGYEISYRGPEIGGFPFALRAHFDQPDIASPRGWRWSGPGIVGRAFLWSPWTIRIDLSGPHRVTRAGLEAATELDAEQAIALVQIDGDGRVATATATTGALRIAHPEGPFSAENSAWRLGPLEPASGDNPQALRIAGELQGVELPAERAGPLGPSLARLAIDAALLGEIPAGDQRRMLEQWRDAGGSLQLDHVELDWGPLGLDGRGTLGLDRKLRPLGAINARLRGLIETLDRFIAAGALEPGQAVPAKIALLTLSGPKDENGERVIALPITLREGRLFLGPVPLLRISPIL